MKKYLAKLILFIDNIVFALGLIIIGFSVFIFLGPTYLYDSLIKWTEENK